MSSRCQTCGRAYRGDCNHGFTDAELRVIRDGPPDAPKRTPRVCPECRQTEDCELRLEAEVERLRAAIRDGHTIEKEPDGTVVVYGNPKPEHNCDEMGCPSIRHVLLVLPALTKSEGE